VRLEAVGKRYGLRQPWVVRDVTVDVAAGRLIRLEGRNGSGKSTLLRVVAGAVLPSAGRVMSRPRTGYVPERFPPALPFSGRDYLAHLGRAHGLRGAALAARIEECLSRLGAADYAGLPMRNLSKGMCQKIAVAQALLARPGLLVLDEAWTGLDQAARQVLDTAVAERVADGGRVLFVDHDPRRLAGLTDERWLVDGGRVTATGGPGPGAAPAAETGAGPGRCVIELAGAGPDLAAALGRMPGVHSVRAQADRLVVRADAAASDSVLRAALASGGPHVLTVREEGQARP
jgi:ABC-type multidrug transport system ATPase subunit